MLAHFWHYRGSISQAISEATDSKDIRAEEEPTSLQAIEKMPILRFIIFVWAFVQAVKIIGCTRIPWTQAWAFCYILPYCLYEIIGIWTTLASNERLNTTTTNNNGSLRCLNRSLEKIDKYIGYIAGVAHMALVAWLFFKLLNPLGSKFWVMLLLSTANLLTLIIALDLLGVAWMTRILFGDDFFSGRKPPSILWLICMMLTILGIEYPLMTEPGMSLVWKASEIIGPVEVGLAILYFLYWLIRLLPEMADQVDFFRTHFLILPIGPSQCGEERTALVVFLVFIVSLVLSTLGYAFVYDPAGSFKPDWTNSFG